METRIETLLKQARSLLRAGDAPGAERRLRESLLQTPEHGPSLALLAVVVGRSGRDDECIDLLKRAIDFSSGEEAAASAILLAGAYERAKRLAEAEGAYNQAVMFAPTRLDARLRLVFLLQRQARHVEAIEAARSAIIVDRASASAHSLLASSLFAIGELADAAQNAVQAVELGSSASPYVGNLAVIRNAQGAHAEAERLCRSALLGGEDAALLNTLGVALKEQSKIDEAGICLERAVELQPQSVEALYNLAGARKDQGRTDEALALLRRAVALAPDLAPGHLALCMANLPPIYIDEAEIHRRRADYGAALDQLTRQAERWDAGELAAGFGAAQPFYLPYQGLDDVSLQRRYGALICQAMAKAVPPGRLAGPLRSGERLRLGVVCGHIRDHSVWRLPTKGWVEALDRSRFELIGYHTSPVRDLETERAEALFDVFVQGPLPFETWRRRIAEDRPHALIFPEIGMDPMAARLAALRLAGVQYVSWGHPTTSGYPTIDYFLTSDLMETDDAAERYTEEVVRLPGLSTPVTLNPFAGSNVQRASLGISATATVYWCGQSLPKYLPQYDWIFAAIAERTPGSQFVFIDFPGSPALTDRLRRRLEKVFTDRGLSSDDYCVWLPRMTPAGFLAALGAADIVLDSLGWSGCNTLLDALRHGLPIVTCPQDTMRSRHGAAILSLLDLDDLICASAPDYVRVAATLAEEGARGALRARVRSSLMQLADRRSITALEAHILSAVSRAVPPDQMPAYH